MIIKFFICIFLISMVIVFFISDLGKLIIYGVILFVRNLAESTLLLCGALKNVYGTSNKLSSLLEVLIFSAILLVQISIIMFFVYITKELLKVAFL